MYYIIGTEKQYQGFNKHSLPVVPESVWNALADRVRIMDMYYGADRDIDKDMGGYCVIFLSNQALKVNKYEMILNRYHLQPGEWEYQEQITDDNLSVVWMEELYLVDSDYGVVIFYPILERQD